MKPNNICPLGCATGVEVNRLDPGTLIQRYSAYYRISLPEEIVAKYFIDQVARLQCPECELQWFAGIPAAEGDFYENLQTNDWYYAEDTWDKRIALGILKTLPKSRVLEIGSGAGHFIRRVSESGIPAAGIELNRRARESCVREGLQVFGTDERDWEKFNADTVVMLQVLEHVEDPIKFMQLYVNARRVDNVVIAVPCADSLLARSIDPLMWLPHHVTLWSRESLTRLAEKLGFTISEVHLEAATWGDFNARACHERNRKLHGLWPWPEGRIGKLMFVIASRLRLPWTRCSHSILVVMKRKSTI